VAWILVFLHVLCHTDSSFLTLKAEGFGNLGSLFIVISLSSAALIVMNFGNKKWFRYLTQHSKSLDMLQLKLALYVNGLGKLIEQKLGFRLIRNGAAIKVHRRISIISYGLVERLGYLGLIILNLVPIVPFAKEAGLVGGQLLGLEKTLPVSLFFNGLRLFLIFKLFF
jgi:hypothetical protein